MYPDGAAACRGQQRIRPPVLMHVARFSEETFDIENRPDLVRGNNIVRFAPSEKSIW
jgi:hypothetical protein